MVRSAYKAQPDKKKAAVRAAYRSEPDKKRAAARAAARAAYRTQPDKKGWQLEQPTLPNVLKGRPCLRHTTRLIAVPG